MYFYYKDAFILNNKEQFLINLWSFKRCIQEILYVIVLPLSNG